MENLFIIMIWTGGFGLLLCLGVGIQKLSSRALKWFRRLRYRQDIKKATEKAKNNFKSYNKILNKEGYKNVQEDNRTFSIPTIR